MDPRIDHYRKLLHGFDKRMFDFKHNGGESPSKDSCAATMYNAKAFIDISRRYAKSLVAERVMAQATYDTALAHLNTLR